MMINILPLLSILLSPLFAHAMTEVDRMEEYHKRGYQWPLKEVVPNTEGWRRLADRKFEQVERMDDDGKYDGWVQTMSSALVAPNFTEAG